MEKKAISGTDHPLVQIPINNMWGLGRRDTKETYCIESWGKGGFFDLFEENEQIDVTVNGERYTVKFGCYFVYHNKPNQ